MIDAIIAGAITTAIVAVGVFGYLAYSGLIYLVNLIRKGGVK